jgi:hypothetical protein
MGITLRSVPNDRCAAHGRRHPHDNPSAPRYDALRLTNQGQPAECHRERHTH